MSLLAELIVSLRAMVDAARESAGAIRAAGDQVEGSLEQVRAATVGSNSPLVAEGDGQLQAALDKIDEAAVFLEAGNRSWEAYIAGPLLGGGSAGGGGSSPGQPSMPAAPEPARPSPDFSQARFDDRKLTDYALNPDHLVGSNKARVIKSRTGFGAGDATEVKRQIMEKAPLAEAVEGHADEHGTRWRVDVHLSGPSGTMKVRTGWITGMTGETRLVTISFPPKGER